MKVARTLLTLILACVLSMPALGRRKPRSVTGAAADYIVNKLEETAVSVPVDQEACFSPDDQCDVKLWKFFQTAQKSLDIAVYDLTHVKLTHEIMVASKRIPVRVIVDLRQAKTERSLVSLLIKGGVQVRIGNQRGIMHNKFTVLDGKWVETGSFNYTNNATEKNNENQLYLNSAKVADQYQKRFERIWGEAKPPPAQISRG